MAIALGRVRVWMGDLETDFVDAIKSDLSVPDIDILFAPHHGRASGRVPSDVLEAMDPKIVVVGEAPSKHLNYYAGYNTLTQNSAGDLTFECVEGAVHIHCSSDTYTVNFLENHKRSNAYGRYLGTLPV